MKTSSLALLALLGAGSIPVCTLAADAPAKRPADAPPAQAAGVLTRAPAVVTPAQPEYPADARAQGLTGSVTLQLEISETGQVTDAVVTTPGGHGFDEAALAAARRLVFSPAEIDGKPAAVRIEYRYDFALTVAPPPAAAEAPVNLRGRVMEMGTRVPVVAAQVKAGERTTFTDKDGRFALTVPLGEVQVTVTDPAHARYEVAESIAEGKATEVTYWILRTALGDADTIVTGKREKREVSQTVLTPGEIRRVAGVNGDTIKVIQNLPGVARAPFGFGQLVVRGGNPRDTRVYVDGLPVPGVFHFGGLYSIYSSELVKEVEFQPGNFGASSGRAIGGRINVVTRDPGDRTHAVGDLNLYLGTGFWEGKVADGVGVALAARRSWADYFIRKGLEKAKDGPGVTVAPQFYDFQGKLAWTMTPRDTLRLDVFGSQDRMVLTSLRTGELSNANVLKDETQFYMTQLRYEHRFSEHGRLLLSAGAGWQEVVAQFGDRFLETDHVWTTIYRAELRQRLLPWLELSLGGDAQWNPKVDVSVTAGTLDVPGQISSGIEDQLTPNRFRKQMSGYEAGVFAEAVIQPASWLRITPGVRADVHRSSLATLTWVDPRLAVRAELDDRTALRGAVGLYHQAPPLPYLTEEWGNPDLTYEQSWQYSLGAERKLLAHLSLDAEVYYKRLTHLALPTSDLVRRDGQLVPLHFVSAGSGKAYGAELLLRWDPDGRFFGWIAYSLSRTRRDQASNGGRLEQEGSAYDQPHNLVAVGTLELPEVWEGLSAGFRLRYTSGNPYERVRGAVYDADSDSYQPITTGRYNRRMPDFFQLDLRVDRKKTFRLWSLTTYLEVQNVTLRKNPEFPAYSYDYTKQGWVSGIGFFPAFGVRAEY